MSSPWKFAYEFGGGFKYMLVGQIGINLQYSNAINTAAAYGLPPNATQSGDQFIPGMNARGYFFNSLLNLGVVYTWK